MGVDGLNPSDPGIALLAAAVRGVRAEEVLLAGCGEVPGVGDGARRWILDVRELAGARHRCIPITDAAGDGFRHALVWPRAHLGRDFAKWTMSRGLEALAPGGELWVAIRKSKGAASTRSDLRELAAEVEVVDRSRGYQLLRAVDRDVDPARAEEAVSAASLDTAYAWTHPLLPGIEMVGRSGVFSRKGLDRGTEALLAWAAAQDLPRGRWLDPGTGLGPIALWLGSRENQVDAIDSNVRAVACARDNVARAGLGDHVRVHAADGVAGALDLTPPYDGVLCNPPTHADDAALMAFVAPLAQQLRPGAPAVFVVNRPHMLTRALSACGATHEAHWTEPASAPRLAGESRGASQSGGGFFVVRATFGRP